jgi:two-component system, NarL family, nitrate/nitrite response regulator NarL
MQVLPELTRHIRILLVDDHKSMLWGLERLIDSEKPHMEVVGLASNRAETFLALTNQKPDVVLLDIDLNGENGLDFIEEILTQSTARVLVLTGLQDTAVHQKAILSGASGVVLKSEKAEVILRAIKFVHAGEMWFDRAATSRLLKSLNSSVTASNQDVHKTRIATLTPKERQVMTAMAAIPGARNKAVADRLFMSEHTLRNHLTVIYAKLALENRLELLMFVIEHKLTDTSAASRPHSPH